MAGGALAFFWNRRRGSNEVAGAGGAADAAFGGLPAPGTSAATLAGAPTRRVTDTQLAAMATIEFVPPRGLEPWMGQALLRELVDQDTVVAWFSELIAQEAMVITTDGDDHALAPGPQRDRVSAADQMHIAQLFRKESSIELGTYDATFAGTWKRVSEEQQDFIRDSGWWSSTTGRGSSIVAGFLGALIVIGVLFAVNIINFAGQGLGLLTSPWLAIVLGIALPFFVGLLAYSAMVPSRTATGSALALRTESFRRFLASSEGKHVAVGVGQRPPARIQRVGGGARCRRCMGAGDPGEQHPRTAGGARRAAPRALARVFDGQHDDPTAVVERVERRLQRRRWRGRWWRWQLWFVVNNSPDRRRRCPRPQDGGLVDAGVGYRVMP